MLAQDMLINQLKIRPRAVYYYPVSCCSVILGRNIAVQQKYGKSENSIIYFDFSKENEVFSVGCNSRGLHLD